MEAVLRAEKKKRFVDPQVERAMKVHDTNPAGNFPWSANPKPVEKEEVEGVKGAFLLRNVSDRWGSWSKSFQKNSQFLIFFITAPISSV